MVTARAVTTETGRRLYRDTQQRVSLSHNQFNQEKVKFKSKNKITETPFLLGAILYHDRYSLLARYVHERGIEAHKKINLISCQHWYAIETKEKIYVYKKGFIHELDRQLKEKL